MAAIVLQHKQKDEEREYNASRRKTIMVDFVL